MIKASIKVGSGATRFRMIVQPESIRRALSIAGKRYPQRHQGDVPDRVRDVLCRSCRAAGLVEMQESVAG